VKAEPAPEPIKSSVATNGLVAVLFVPADAKGPLPAIIILGGSEGGMGAASARDGRVIAQHGYVTLQLAYFDAPGLPKGLGFDSVGVFQNRHRLAAHASGERDFTADRSADYADALRIHARLRR
jgi:dienelactone hydrolase